MSMTKSDLNGLSLGQTSQEAKVYSAFGIKPHLADRKQS